MPAGIARDHTNGNLFITTMSSGKAFKVTPSGVRSELKSGLEGPWGIDVDSATGDVYIAEVNGGKVTKVSSAGHSTTYVSGLSNVAGLTRDISNGDIFVTTYSETGMIKKIDIHGEVTNVVAASFNRPRGITLRQGTKDLFFVAGDPAHIGASLIKKVNVVTGIVMDFAAGFGSLYDIYAPPSEPYIYTTDLGKHFIMKVNENGHVYKYANQRKMYTSPSNQQVSMESMAPYSLTRDDSLGIIYATNHWSDVGNDPTSNYYNQVEDNVVKVTDNRFSTGYKRRRLWKRSSGAFLKSYSPVILKEKDFTNV